MDSTTQSNLLAMRSEALTLQDEIGIQRAIIEEAEAIIKQTSPRKLNLQREYWKERALVILHELADRKKALCASCHKLKSVDSMRCLRESNFASRSDCSYSQWTEYWSRDLPICMKCSEKFTYSVTVQENKPVGMQLLPFDEEAHNTWVVGDGEHLNNVEAKLHLGLPPIP